MSEYIALKGRAKDIAGQRFGRLIALGPVSQDAEKKIIWRCLCDCGNTSDVRSNSLRCGHTLSCGCWHRERKITHGMAGTPIHGTWNSMVTRCTNPNVKDYAYYGGRGISVYPAWARDIHEFLDYVSRLPHYGESGYTLDRIDNDGDYSPGNVRWASPRTQHRNRRDNVMLTHNGKTQCQADWAEELGMDQNTLYMRLRSGWSVERALTQPVRPARGTR